MGEPAILPFNWQDPFDLDHQLSDEERLVRDTAEGYAQEKLQPRVTSAYLDRFVEQARLLTDTDSESESEDQISYLRYVAQMGRRIAEMHVALASRDDIDGFLASWSHQEVYFEGDAVRVHGSPGSEQRQDHEIMESA